MLNVKTPEEVIEIIKSNFNNLEKEETIKIEDSLSRVLSRDVFSNEYVPSFNRSTVDGYAIIAKDSFGTSEAMPTILNVLEEVKMGESAKYQIKENTCSYVPTGGAIPENSDAVCMIEHTEKYSDNEIAILKPCAPLENIILKGDDSKPNDLIKAKGSIIKAQDIGTFASLGIREVKVKKKLLVGIISTGDELVDISFKPNDGQIRDVNSYLLHSLFTKWGCESKRYGFFNDDEELLRNVISKATHECDLIVISGGSSVGQKDLSARLIEEYSPLLFHGIAIKPGKPTILGKANNKPILGLPGHPGAAFFVTNLFGKVLVDTLMGITESKYYVKATLLENVSANQGRALCLGVKLIDDGDCYYAKTISSKSGLITTLTNADGYILVPRDLEGLNKNSEVKVYLI